jgi:hypothetical protein
MKVILNRTKVFIIVAIAIISIILIAINLFDRYSQKAARSKYFIEKSKEIKTGMTIDEVVYIMGQPDTIIQNRNIIYCYDISDDSFGNGQIIFDSTYKVQDSYFPIK